MLWPLWKIVWQLLIKLNNINHMTQQFPSWVFTPKKWKFMFPQNLNTSAYGSSTYNHPKPETTQMSFNRWINKMWYNPYNGILPSNKKEWTIDTCNNLDESSKRHYAERKKSVRKDYILYDSIKWLSQKDKTKVRENRSQFPGVRKTGR